MYKIELRIGTTETKTAQYATIYFNTGLSLFESSDGRYTYVLDGLHNGGWRIPTAFYSYGEIVEMIDNVIKGEK